MNQNWTKKIPMKLWIMFTIYFLVHPYISSVGKTTNNPLIKYINQNYTEEAIININNVVCLLLNKTIVFVCTFTLDKEWIFCFFLKKSFFASCCIFCSKFLYSIGMRPLLQNTWEFYVKLDIYLQRTLWSLGKTVIIC